MKNLVPWLKSNWLIVVLLLIVLVSLPTALYFSSSMNRSLREKFQQEITKDEGALKKNTIQYRIASPIPGTPDVEHSATANERLINWFAEQRSRIQAEATQVWNNALELNRAGHEILLDGIFPAPPPGADERVARADFTSRFLQLPDELMKTMNAGPPPDPRALVATLAELAERRRQQLLAQAGGDNLDEFQTQTILDELAAVRRAEYRRRAQEISVYADRTVFKDVPAFSPEQLREPPSLAFCWQWQEAAWVLQDLAKAIALANANSSSADGRSSSVHDSVVKRIVSIKVLEAPAPPGGGEEGSSRRSSSGGGLVTTDPSVSLTGRVSGAGTDNQLYDVRLAQCEFIVDTQRLPQFLDALGRVNFMTVIDLDLERVDPAEDLLEGYDYGSSHVVKAKMMIETLWLREWIVAHMPPAEKALRGVDESKIGTQTPPG